jgi:hypothetical protein
MGVDVLNLIGIDLRIVERIGHGFARTLAVLRRCGDVKRIAAHPKADDLGIYLGAPRLRLLVFLEHHGACAVAHHEAVAILVPGTARRLGIIVAL